MPDVLSNRLVNESQVSAAMVNIDYETPQANVIPATNAAPPSYRGTWVALALAVVPWLALWLVRIACPDRLPDGRDNYDSLAYFFCAYFGGIGANIVGTILPAFGARTGRLRASAMILNSLSGLVLVLWRDQVLGMLGF